MEEFPQEDARHCSLASTMDMHKPKAQTHTHHKKTLKPNKMTFTKHFNTTPQNYQSHQKEASEKFRAKKQGEW